jgi:hypothetical protein
MLKTSKISNARTSGNVDPLEKQVDCDICPAAGHWGYMGPGRWCFHRAYYLGKSGPPVSCESAKRDCPLKKKHQRDFETDIDSIIGGEHGKSSAKTMTIKKPLYRKSAKQKLLNLPEKKRIYVGKLNG